MKTLLLIRHAKSDWGNDGLSDFDRPLNDRGKKDAPVMAERLLKRGVKPDLFISSPAKRAAKTASFFAEAYGVAKKEIVLVDALYLPATDIFYDVLEKLDDQYNQVALFSHNNGITDFANELTNARIDNIPTCGIFAINIYLSHWKDFRTAEKSFWFFDSPKAGH